MAHGIGLSLAHRPFVPVFIPTDISNLALWLKYDTGITSENDETSAANDIDDNDRIKQWDDQSGNNNHAAQSTQADMPRFESDDNSIKFANRAKFLDLTSELSIANDFTCIIHINWITNSVEQALMGHSALDLWRLQDNTNFRVKISDSTQSNWVEAGDTIDAENWYILTLTRSGGAGNLTVHVDGGTYSDKEWDSAEGATDTDTFSISNIGSAADDTTPLNAYVKDVLIYNGTALNKAQRTDMYNYINSQTADL